MTEQQLSNEISISQTVAILMDGNNIERSIHSESKNSSSMLNIDLLIPKLLDNRQLNRMVYFREGQHISNKLKERLQANYHGSVRPCHKSADIPLTIKATQLANKVDTIIIMSGDSDFVELVTHLQGMGVRVEIASVRSTTSKLLLDVADQFHEITSEDWFSVSKTGRITKGRPTRKKQVRKVSSQESSSEPEVNEAKATNKKSSAKKQRTLEEKHSDSL